MKMRRYFTVLLPALFFGLIVAARAWFWSAPSTPTEFLRFTVNREPANWKFVPEPVGEVAQGILATTNLFNGTFVGPEGQRITAFAAHWLAESSEAMSVVQHTPDICWVGAGWKPSLAGQPERVQLAVGERAIPFECRVFTPPGGHGQELVLWSTLVGGSLIEETDRWSIEQSTEVDSRTRWDWAGRRVGANQFVKNVLQRRRGVGEKQFVRFSTSMTDGWQAALERMKTFAPLWLELSVEGSSLGVRRISPP